MRKSLVVSLLFLASFAVACGDDDGNEAARLGVGAQCTVTTDCPVVSLEGDAGMQQLECILDFKGGYCGLTNCVNNAGCPDGSVCVAHTNGQSYCFRTCVDKPECNGARDVDNEANCSSSFDFQVPAEDMGEKACIPPSN